MGDARFKNLRVWQEAMRVAKEIYKITRTFPESEKFGLTSQLQRAAVSIPSNIAEGSGRNTKKDFAHFLGQARGSLYEVITQLEICVSIGILKLEQISKLLNECESLSKQLNALISSLN
jgi:four helix bundle protein